MKKNNALRIILGALCGKAVLLQPKRIHYRQGVDRVANLPKIIFRDDDTSYFTSPWQLEAIYGRLWEAGWPVCLAVIPKVYGDIRVYWTDGNPHDPGLPPQHRGKDEYFSILDNAELCQFLNDKAAAGLVEICLHGYSHIFYEFITHRRPVIRQKLEKGLAILNQAFPAASIQTFVAPYDRLSPTAISELIQGGFHISTQSVNLAAVPGLPQLTGHQAAAINQAQMLYVCDEYLFSYQVDPSESLRRARTATANYDLTMVSSHYWMFFYPWRSSPNAADITCWNSLLDDVLERGSFEVTTFAKNAHSTGFHLDSKLDDDL